VLLAYRRCTARTPPTQPPTQHPSHRSTGAIVLILARHFPKLDASYTRQGTFHLVAALPTPPVPPLPQHSWVHVTTRQYSLRFNRSNYAGALSLLGLPLSIPGLWRGNQGRLTLEVERCRHIEPPHQVVRSIRRWQSGFEKGSLDVRLNRAPVWTWRSS
jgi:hypothetical protein